MTDDEIKERLEDLVDVTPHDAEGDVESEVEGIHSIHPLNAVFETNPTHTYRIWHTMPPWDVEMVSGGSNSGDGDYVVVDTYEGWFASWSADFSQFTIVTHDERPEVLGQACIIIFPKDRVFKVEMWQHTALPKEIVEMFGMGSHLPLVSDDGEDNGIASTGQYL